MKDVKTGRPYRSERRKEQARATRAAILRAARSLFVERGYEGATMEAIAEAAGVATITVYATFKSKRALLAEMIGAAVSGDQATVPVYEQEGALAIGRERDQRRQLELFAADIGGIMAKVSPLFEVMDHAAHTQPEIAELRERMLLARREGMRAFVKRLAAHGSLRVDEDEASETVWAITSPQLYRLLTRDLGWEPQRWSAWVARTLAAVLLG